MTKWLLADIIVDRKAILLFIFFKVKPRRKTRRSNKAMPNGGGNVRRDIAICLGIVLAISLASAVSKVPQKIALEKAEHGSIEEMEPRSHQGTGGSDSKESADISLEGVPEYSGSPYCELNGNDPSFTAEDIELLSSPGYEYYSALDSLGRCGFCEACVGPETQPEGEERGEIWEVRPSGWRSGQGWERCHLIAWALTGENANDHNLVTGTHSMNVEGMLPFEIEAAEAADRGVHVMYRVTPLYKGNELICRGVHMTAKSVEDDSVSFNIFVYNVEPGKKIDYVSGYIY